MASPVPPDPARLAAFAAKAEALGPEAWERIAARCGVLDEPTVRGFFSRAELASHSFAGLSDPYTEPFTAPLLGMLGGAWGLVAETLQLVRPFDRIEWEGALRKARESGRDNALAQALLRVLALAAGQQETHPGTASALRTIGLLLMISSHRAAANPAVIYAPFEPEIPFASLSQPDQHAA
jgi:hypothetical protein